jgi:hypothetical protein
MTLTDDAATKAEALAYLEWLDAGNAGKHYLVPKVPA